MKSDQAKVRLEQVSLQLGQQHFFFDTSFEAAKVTAVVGPSGSGKSTLLNLVAGFEKPTGGRVLIGADDMGGRDPAERPISLIFQDNNLFAHLDIATNIGLGISPSLRLTQDDKAKIASALERVGLAGFEKRLPSSMSGGERQRAALARALVRQRAVMLLDEPFAALDPGLRAGMAGLLKELQSENGNTVLLVTHHPDDIRRLADAVVFLSDGKILFQGATEAFFSATDIPEVGAFLQK
ncbi:ATP-binding cassette domain-containing protein [Rhizobium rhizogenes]|uniref:Thiamine ABC transporter ATP-binding protein n=1 Tax=Rhizobium rhizogenes TaxID=359 RepID=A0AA92C229_RHIRH|nr:ATP-binding cassette domain-containing protein [Rhizobium rhizogenes]PVE53166.1 thiamine ABC transporter ATP-binding protein [Rhizobium rhizogenes]PVE63403.1 thiamine ABC transporter ATP-binding protein [Agrobacterium tumefaciens]PVE72294.1 thiamine ABC transporter ATP-binding protein [Sphingomonas sp. TPD3009]